jgi:phytol kinase
VLINDLVGLGQYIGLVILIGVPVLLFKMAVRLPFELSRKLYHMLISMTIFPLVQFFSTWYMAVLAALLLGLILYPVLILLKNTTFFKKIAVERAGGEFKRSLLIIQGTLALLLFVFWGLLGPQWKYVAVVAVMAWSFGDAAAALVGKRFGRFLIRHPWIQGKKTLEGTQAMYIAAGLAIFFTLLLYAGQPWYVSLSVALLVAPVSAVVELFSNWGMDTLTVPISTGLAVLPLMWLFSLLAG